MGDVQFRVDVVEDRPKGGMWHCGPNPAWVTVTHLPTMTQIRAYHERQHKAREFAMACVEMLLFEAPVDPRGNLMLTYLAIAARYRPRWLVWENVPGVLSSNGGRDFGSLLGGLGELGYGFAYRVLDAQFIRTRRFSRAVPQRRRRVFVVGYLGDWRRAAAVLFDRESLSGNPPPRREARQATAKIVGGGPVGGRISGTVSTKWSKGTGGPAGDEAYNLIAFNSREDPEVTYDRAGPLSASSPQAQAVAWSIMPQNSGKDYKARQVDVAQPLMAGGPVGGQPRRRLHPARLGRPPPDPARMRAPAGFPRRLHRCALWPAQLDAGRPALQGPRQFDGGQRHGMARRAHRDGGRDGAGSMTEETIGNCRMILSDCRDVLPDLGEVDAIVTDPPYGQTSLEWDRWCEGWVGPASAALRSSGSMWVFGTLRMFMDRRDDFRDLRLAQDIVWEKHNGSSFHADRFRRVHEQAVQFYRGDWGSVYKGTVVTMGAQRRTVRNKTRPPHMGKIDKIPYETEDGGPLLMRSVMFVRSEHGRAEHETQKPIGIVAPLIENACPVGGLVLDPFMGSGTTLVAAAMLGRSAIGIEANEKYFATACRRVEEAHRSGDLFSPAAMAVQV